MKMHGLGNDFLVLDSRVQKFDVSPAMVSKLADRNRSVGFDQLAVIGESNAADLSLVFYNPDGSSSDTCCNATRCIADWEMSNANKVTLKIQTPSGILAAIDRGNGLTSINMGQPRTLWNEIPLRDAVDTLHLPIDGDPVATSMGNPHCTFFVDQIEKINLEQFGASIETHPLFPQRTNVQIAEIVDVNRIRMRVWERGTGITLASGSSCCAVAVAAIRRNLTTSTVKLTLDGGEASVSWDDSGVWMTGPTEHVFNGTFTEKYLKSISHSDQDANHLELQN